MIIDPDRKPLTMESSKLRRRKNAERRAKKPKLTKAQRKAERAKLIHPAGHVTATLARRARIERLKARGKIRTPHTRQLWAAYHRGDLAHQGVFCIG